MDQGVTNTDEAPVPYAGRLLHKGIAMLVLAILFVLGTINFALNRAVLESGHPVFEQMPPSLRRIAVPLALIAEFVFLLAAMLLSAHGWTSMAWLYGGYFGLNLASSWMMLSGRM